MKKFLSIFKKDFLLLIRDWPGLVILFLMPAVLLVVITFIQQNSIPSKKTGFRVIVVNADSTLLGDVIVKDLAGSEFFECIFLNSSAEAQKAILDGESMLAIVIPDSATERLFMRIENETGKNDHPKVISTNDLHEITFLYDPGMQRLIQETVVRPLKIIIQLSALKVIIGRYNEEVKNSLVNHSSDLAEAISGIDYDTKIPDFPYKNEIIERLREELYTIVKEKSNITIPANSFINSEQLKINEQIAGQQGLEFKPNALQNNIPAFTLFAMFFIVIPLAGSIINEKNHGTYKRLRTLPVSYLGIIMAKISVFFVVCILQFIFLLIVGIFIMPQLGEIPALNANVNFPALSAALISSSLAAIGFGIVVGTFASTHSQAATFGSVMVVILALLGGIFVPVNILPEMLKKITFISPLRWGTDAFIGMFAKGYSIGKIWPELCLLLGFFALSLLLSIRTFYNNK